MTIAPERRRGRAARRGNNEGTAPFQRADGRWCAAVSADNGKRKYLYGKTRREVADKLATVLKDAQQGLPLPNERVRLATYVADWLEHTVRPSQKPHTYVRYRQAARVHIVPTIGTVPLARLGPADVQRLQNRMVALGHKPASIRAVRTALSAALTQAVKWGLIVRNPVLLVDGPRADEREPVPLAPEQAAAFLAEAKGHEFEHLFLIMLATGLRIGAALGLPAAAVDLPAGHLLVRQQVIEIPGQPRALSEPKSKRARRTVPLIPAAAGAFHAQRARVLEYRLRAAGAWQDHGLVFPDELGQPLGSHRVEHAFKRLIAQAAMASPEAFGLASTPMVEQARRAVASFTPHTLRHSTATYLMAVGVPDRVVMDMLGHGSLAVTSRYEHVLSGMLSDAAERLAKVFPTAAATQAW